MKQKAYIVIYTMLVTAVFAGLVSSINAALQARIERNRTLATQRVILSLFGEEVASLSDEEASQRFRKKVESVTVDDVADWAGTYEYFRWGGPEKGGTVVIPLFGQGFWGPMAGYMALRPGDSLGALQFTRHEETPGLGGRVDEAWFRQQFDGLAIPQPKQPATRLRYTAPDDENARNEFDAITGATETTRAVERIVNQSVLRYLDAVRGEETP